MPSDDRGFAFSSRVIPKVSKIKAPYKSWNYQIRSIDILRTFFAQVHGRQDTFLFHDCVCRFESERLLVRPLTTVAYRLEPPLHCQPHVLAGTFPYLRGRAHDLEAQSPQHRQGGAMGGAGASARSSAQRQHPACVGPDDLDASEIGWTRVARQRCRHGPTARAAPLAGTCRRLSCLLLLFRYFPWRRAISIPTGRALVVGHPLEPLARATLRAETQRGMVHRDQVRRRSRRVIRGHEVTPPLPRGRQEHLCS